MPTLKVDKVLVDDAAQALAREAAVAIAEPGTVGDHVKAEMTSDRLATHHFACTAKGYPGWVWSVLLARAPRQRHATICETHLLPTSEALLSPEWLPYAERLAPGDVNAGDVTPYVADDPSLEFGFEATGEEDVDQVAIFELGLGRTRVLSGEGRELAARRWYDGDHGPQAEVAKQAPAACGSCGFLVPMAGVLRQTFGVCASEWSPSDGSVVSLDHGCGAHSEADAPASSPERVEPPVMDDFAVDVST
ncbi:DUF3027 domain-containing protein [Demetria terragena]|uniref:DUF3027 domain-containing protein n=1 Tax=Demetria terragena TaxID=63959 RepID=UPI00037B8CA3|nr:DUF3027 domain-containing protein [Demetria terragena]